MPAGYVLQTGEGAPPTYEAEQFLGTQESADSIQTWIESCGARVSVVVVGDERRLIIHGIGGSLVVEGDETWIVRHVATNSIYTLSNARFTAEYGD